VILQACAEVQRAMESLVKEVEYHWMLARGQQEGGAPASDPNSEPTCAREPTCTASAADSHGCNMYADAHPGGLFSTSTKVPTRPDHPCPSPPSHGQVRGIKADHVYHMPYRDDAQ
jgi:hypothetical protein